MSETLKSLVKDLNALEELIIENDGQVCETLEVWMQINETNVATKVDGYNFLIARLEKSAEFFKDKEAEYYAARKVYENQVIRMKAYVKDTMFAMGLDELKGNEYRFKLSKSKPKVIIDNVEELPLEYTREKITIEVDKDGIKKALDEGIEIKGASLETSFSLRSYLIKKGL